MKFASLLVLIATTMLSPAFGTEWEFPEDGPSSSGETMLGKTGNFRYFQTVTTHRPEEVVLWYAKKLKLGESHDLVKKAKAGFRSLDKLTSLSFNEVRDTNEEKSGAIISAMLSPEIAHIQIFFRPENNPDSDLTISIAKTSTGTAISVIESLADQNSKNLARARNEGFKGDIRSNSSKRELTKQ